MRKFMTLIRTVLSTIPSISIKVHDYSTTSHPSVFHGCTCHAKFSVAKNHETLTLFFFSEWVCQMLNKALLRRDGHKLALMMPLCKKLESPFSLRKLHIYMYSFFIGTQVNHEWSLVSHFLLLFSHSSV